MRQNLTPARSSRRTLFRKPSCPKDPLCGPPYTNRGETLLNTSAPERSAPESRNLLSAANAGALEVFPGCSPDRQGNKQSRRFRPFSATIAPVEKCEASSGRFPPKSSAEGERKKPWRQTSRCPRDFCRPLPPLRGRGGRTLRRAGPQRSRRVAADARTAPCASASRAPARGSRTKKASVKFRTGKNAKRRAGPPRRPAPSTGACGTNRRRTVASDREYSGFLFRSPRHE